MRITQERSESAYLSTLDDEALHAANGAEVSKAPAERPAPDAADPESAGPLLRGNLLLVLVVGLLFLLAALGLILAF
jgi:hypothetical protein